MKWEMCGQAIATFQIFLTPTAPSTGLLSFEPSEIRMAPFLTVRVQQLLHACG